MRSSTPLQRPRCRPVHPGASGNRGKSEAPAASVSLIRAADGVWEEVLAGVSVKKLSVDRQRGFVTMLIRMAAGTAYPSHRHSQAEECLVLEGSLHVGTDIVMEAGDFQRAEAGSVHVPQYTDDGCLLLVTSSLEDELLD
jgi:anti-sigma factor ChrR (cupin superfamily)